MSDVLNKLKELDKEREKLLTQAKNAAMKKAEDAIAELNALGFNFQLTEKGAVTSGSRKGTRSVDPSKPCGYCGYQTNPPHDKRAHRSQEKKAAFTDAELAELGMARV